MLVRIYADFNSQDEEGRIDLGLGRSHRDIVRLGEQLSHGQMVVLYFDDVEVDAVLEFDAQQNRWYGRIPDWSAYRELSGS